MSEVKRTGLHVDLLKRIATRLGRRWKLEEPPGYNSEGAALLAGPDGFALRAWDEIDTDFNRGKLIHHLHLVLCVPRRRHAIPFKVATEGVEERVAQTVEKYLYPDTKPPRRKRA